MAVHFASRRRCSVRYHGIAGILLGTCAFAATRSEVAVPAQTRCAVSKTILAEPPKAPNADRFGHGDWFVNADRTIWVAKQRWQAGDDGNKVLWIRPAGTNLVISGKRLDGEA